MLCWQQYRAVLPHRRYIDGSVHALAALRVALHTTYVISPKGDSPLGASYHIYTVHVQHDLNPQHLYDIFRQGLCMRVSTVLLAMLSVGTFNSPGVRLTVCVT
jgi:hypothetical protein